MDTIFTMFRINPLSILHINIKIRIIKTGVTPKKYRLTPNENECNSPVYYHF
jgi:hypothetical protein